MSNAIAAFPSEARLNQVLGIVRFLKTNDGKLTVRELTQLAEVEVDDLLPQVSAAKILGLVKVHEDDITMTPLAEKIQESDPKAMKAVRLRLQKIEPFKSAFTMSRSKGKFTTEQLVERMERQGLYMDSDPTKNVKLMDQILIQWAIFFNIVDYDGVHDVWIKEHIK